MEIDIDERISNLRKTFWTIRGLWMVIRGRGSRPWVHEALGMSRPRFERFLNGDGTRLSDEEVNRWSKMGFPKSLMSGNKAVQVPFWVEQQWKEFFQAHESYQTQRKNGGPSAGESLKKWKDCKAKLYQTLKTYSKNPKGGTPFDTLCLTIRDSDISVIRPDRTIESISVTLSQITLKQMTTTTSTALRDYMKILNQQYDLAKAVYTIMEYNQK